MENREMRRKDRKTDEAAAYAVAEKCGWFVLSVTLANGEPYCVPLSMVRMGNALYFHCAKSGLKTEALRRDARVCVCCVGEVSPVEGELALLYESAIIRGRAEEVTDKAEMTAALRALGERYTPASMPAFPAELKRDLAHAAVWKIEIESISGKSRKK